MLTNTFYGSSATQKTREAQREAAKASEGLERVLELSNRGEPVGSEKSIRAIDYAIAKLDTVKSRIVKYGELRQMIEKLETVAEEKMNDKRKRVADITKQIDETNQQLEGLLAQHEVLSAQIMAANAVYEIGEGEGEGNGKGDSKEASNNSRYSNGDRVRDSRGVLANYCKGDWDDTVDDDSPQE